MIRNTCHTIKGILKITSALTAFTYGVLAQLIADEIALRTYQPTRQAEPQ